MINNFKGAITSIGFNSVCGTGQNAYYELVHTLPSEKKISTYDPEGFLGTKGIRFLNNATLMYCNLAFQCISNRNLGAKIIAEADKIGLYDGSDLSNIEDGFIFDLTAKMDGPALVSPMSAPNTIANASSSMMAIKSTIKGPNFTVCGGACGSLQALDIALLHLSENMIDCAIVGSTEITSRYHQAVRQGELRGEAQEQDAPEMGIAFSIESLENAQKQGTEILGTILGVHSGQKLRKETSEGLLIRLCSQLLKQTDLSSEQLDGLILSAGSHCIDEVIFKKQVNEKINPDLAIIYPESVHGYGDNAGGFAGMLFGIGLFNQKIKNNLPSLRIDGTPKESYKHLIIATIDRTGYGIVTLLKKA
ncbi:3-oxoacyl-[acyl-carrier-protein] synthase II [Arcicella aurantiaca]|uniref:3-oxoacyl-[acyl-carrier-protein] synthase II n=1 Tax=Arcicella aurantiaca TaxID=591202 RepID=A0A316DK22_9BACT|nr:beta-ketoacyl synthase N-terminal-like domain-containing protein [Arcicella aurantiaca]PWK17619.1 3-oxoacyl-[acyl-carrier-protein] synthase II [Arcicella aurantiaca]